jgi:hypothetical protein
MEEFGVRADCVYSRVAVQLPIRIRGNKGSEESVMGAGLSYRNWV